MEFGAIFVGITIALMLVVNAALQQAIGPAGALVIIHLVGLTAIVPLALLTRAPRPKGPVPWPWFAGGLVGVVLLGINNHTVPALGPGVVVALSVAGQLAASSAVDHWGLFGLPRRPLRVTQAGGLVLALVGMGLVAWGGLG